MKTMHFIYQPKGGTGKTAIATIMSQYLMEREKPVIGFDTDNENFSFTAKKYLDVRRIKIAQDFWKSPAPISFDPAIKIMEEAEDGQHGVVDNGAATAPQFEDYLIQHNVMDVLQNKKINVILHIVVDHQTKHYLNHFNRAVEKFPNIQIVIWVNNYLCDVDLGVKNISEYGGFQKHIDRILGFIEIPNVKLTKFSDAIMSIDMDTTPYISIIKNQLVKDDLRNSVDDYWKKLKFQLDMIPLD